MPDTKISAGADPGTLVATDKLPMARSASTTAYAATMTELAAFANTAYVPNYYTGSPSMDGAAAAGSVAFVSRGDHVHPSDTTRYAASNPSGYQTAAQVTTATAAAIPGASYCDNGGFTINQRTYVSGTALAAGVFGHDRWKGGAGGCTYTFTQSGNPATTLTITAGSLQQAVEGAALIGGTYTLSWTGTAQGRVGGGSYAASPISASVTASANTTIEFNTGTLGHVKFEAGSTATPWVAVPPQQDLANCQRFYSVATSLLFGGYAVGTGTSQWSFWSLPVTMRASPTVAVGALAASNASIAGNGSTTTIVDLTLNATATGIVWASANITASADL